MPIRNQLAGTISCTSRQMINCLHKFAVFALSLCFFESTFYRYAGAVDSTSNSLGSNMSLVLKARLRLFVGNACSHATKHDSNRPFEVLRFCHTHGVAVLDVLLGDNPNPFLLRKKSTPASSPVAPSMGSTQLHHLIDFHRLLTNPTEPPSVSLR